MKVAIIVIGDEILLGQVIDTNSGMIARSLAPYGWSVAKIFTVGDNGDEIAKTIEAAFEAAPVVLTTGGLGPTKDDITKRVMLKYFGGTMRRDESVTKNIRRIFAHKGLTMNKLTEAQADVPTSCKVIENRVGTAPIMWFERDSRRKVLVAMPGVPTETAEMFPTAVMPRLMAHFSPSETVVHHTLMLYGIGESHLAEHLEPWESNLPEGAHLAYLPADGIIRLRLDVKASDRMEATNILERYTHELKQLTQEWLMNDGDTAPAIILLRLLTDRGMTVAIAESCTGGNIAHAITLIPGSSDAMNGGVIAYSNSVKTDVLGVDAKLIDNLGAVSEPVAAKMAQGVCAVTGCNLGISTSGIAGPGGGSREKPVGTVCFGICLNGETTTTTLRFGGSRQQIIDRATTAAMIMAIEKLIKDRRH